MPLFLKPPALLVDAYNFNTGIILKKKREYVFFY